MDKLSQPVLILNTFYMPVSIRSVKDAICLLVLSKAQAIKSADNDFIRSEKVKIPIPRIILLSNYFQIPKKNLKVSRNHILERDGYTCVYCGKRPNPSKLTLDHVIPKSRWNEISKDKKIHFEFNSWENIVTACKECNTKKGNRLLSELRWKNLEPSRLKPKMNLFLSINKNSAEKYGWNEYLSIGK
ncbi:MAG: HNH endonuclease [Leptospiraceae bacterium]|nr:HNH endonuclease [Leptospiraceae bacterium]